MPDSRRIHKTIIESPQQRLAVFDLDSTLFNVSFRTQKIIEAFTNEILHRDQFKSEIEIMRTIKVLASDWGLKQPLVRSGISSNERFFTAARDYWRKHFFSSEFLHADIPYPGAVDYVISLESHGVEIAYLTGRDALNMKNGTLESLKRWGFPLKDGEKNLIMKPVKGSLEDEEYKEIQIKKFEERAAQIWFFENEPLILNKLKMTSPNVNLVWLDTTHSGRSQAPKELPRIAGKYEKS